MSLSILQKIEISFWDIVIQLLTKSNFVRHIISNISQALPDAKYIPIGTLLGIVVISALISGFILFVLMVV